MNPFSLAFREQQQLFLYDKQYLADTLLQPGGFSALTGRFLVQFFGNPVLAVLIVLLCLFGIAWVLRRQFPLVLAPLAFLAASLADPDMHFDVVPALFLAAISFSCWAKAKRKLLWGITFAVVLFPLAGSASFLFSLCVLGYSLGKFEDIVPALCTVAAGLAAAYAAYLLLAVPAFGFALSPSFFYNPGETMPAGHLVFWFALPVSVLLSELLYSVLKKRYAVIAAVLLVLVALPFSFKVYKRTGKLSMQQIYKLNHYASRQNWDALEDASEPYLNYSIASNYFWLAKSCKGTMMKDLMRYPHDGPSDLIYIPSDRTANYALPYVLYHVGNMAGAQNVAYNLVFTSTGYNPSLLKMLCDIDIMRGSYDVAAKYLDILSHSLFYRKWAAQRREFLYDDAKVEADPELGRGRADFPETDGFAVYGSPMNELFAILRANQSDAAAMEYGLAYLLLAKDIRNTSHFVKEFYGTPALQKLPDCAQEALVFFTDYQRSVEHNPEFGFLTEEWCLSHGVEPNTISKLRDFQEASLRNSGRAPARYHNSFWHYLIYVSNSVSRAVIPDRKPVY